MPIGNRVRDRDQCRSPTVRDIEVRRPVPERRTPILSDFEVDVPVRPCPQRARARFALRYATTATTVAAPGHVPAFGRARYQSADRRGTSRSTASRSSIEAVRSTKTTCSPPWPFSVAPAATMVTAAPRAPSLRSLSRRPDRAASPKGWLARFQVRGSPTEFEPWVAKRVVRAPSLSAPLGSRALCCAGNSFAVAVANGFRPR